MIKKIMAILCISVFSINLLFASSNEINLLVNKLVEKNLISQTEGSEIIKSVKSDWKDKFSLYGDFRLRHHVEETDINYKFKERIRFRLGVDAKISDNLTFKGRVATGTGDSRSTNQDFTNQSSKKDIFLDYAYVNNKTKSSESNVGKIPVNEAIFTTNDFLIDSDLTLEGINSNNINYNNLFLNLGYFILNSNSSTTSNLNLAQIGYRNNSLKTYLSYYFFNNLQELGMTQNNNVSLDAQYSLSKNKKLDIFSTYVINTAPIYKEYYDKYTYIVGIKLGNSKKIEKIGDVELSVSFRDLGEYSFYNKFSDSDFYSGNLNSKGFRYNLILGTSKNTFTQISYFDTTKRDGTGYNKLFLIDVNYMF